MAAATSPRRSCRGHYLHDADEARTVSSFFVVSDLPDRFFPPPEVTADSEETMSSEQIGARLNQV